MRILSLFILLFLVSLGKAQEKFVIVKTQDGDQIRCIELFKTIDLETKYGLLKIPVIDISRINFGTHFAKEVDDKISTAIKDLGSTKFKEREEAVKTLVGLGKYSYLRLARLESADLEVQKRKQEIMTRIKNNVPGEIVEKLEDFIETKEFVLKGKIIGYPLKMKSSLFGEFSLNGPELLEISFYSNINQSINLDGKDSGEWYDTGLTLNRGMKLKVSAEGNLDIFPDQPGQYIVGPKGYTMGQGMGWNFPGGALVGKINNNIFVLGDEYRIDMSNTNNEGRLYLTIVPSVWKSNNGNQKPINAGSYSIKIVSSN